MILNSGYNFCLRYIKYVPCIILFRDNKEQQQHLEHITNELGRSSKL
jgi:hypothetical protein